MPVAYIFEFPIGDARQTPRLPDGEARRRADRRAARAYSGFDDEAGVWRQVDVWESREQADRFMEQLMKSVIGVV